MAQHILKLSSFSRNCFWFSSRDSSLFSAERLYSFQVSVRCCNAHILHPVRNFAAAKSGKIQALKKRKRLDEICLERFQQYSRTYIQSWILQGKVFVDGKAVYKAGTPVSDVASVEIKAEVPKYVCRAGHKLEAAIEQLGVEVAGKVALDSGLSTGGFTDCLLQYGASYVYGVDVGYGQVAEKIRKDERVCIVERTNLRHLSGLPQKVDLVTLDLSFISILLVMPAVVNVMKEEATLITLIKPQFEARRNQVGSGGIVRDAAVRQEVLDRIIKGVESHGFKCQGWIESPLKGAEGNIEFLASFYRTSMTNTDSSPAEKQLDPVVLKGDDGKRSSTQKGIPNFVPNFPPTHKEFGGTLKQGGPRPNVWL